jgi:hypothetical protein
MEYYNIGYEQCLKDSRKTDMSRLLIKNKHFWLFVPWKRKK